MRIPMSAPFVGLQSLLPRCIVQDYQQYMLRAGDSPSGILEELYCSSYAEWSSTTFEQLQMAKHITHINTAGAQLGHVCHHEQADDGDQRTPRINCSTMVFSRSRTNSSGLYAQYTEGNVPSLPPSSTKILPLQYAPALDTR